MKRFGALNLSPVVSRPSVSFAKVDLVLSTIRGVLGEQIEIKELDTHLGKIILENH